MRSTERRSRRHYLAATLAACAALAAGVFAAPPRPEVKMEPVKPAPVAADPAAGKALYERHCAQCHGEQGKGDGPAADLVYPRPRDFTLALYKVRSTPTGQLPTDQDLYRAISEGLPGTSMPPWKKYLSEAERWQLVHQVKTFDVLDLFRDEPQKARIAVGSPPRITPELLARGKDLYESKKCGQCHGQYGRGDGTSADQMKDDWGFPIRPVNFTKGWRFRAGDRVEDIYRTFTTGFNGTPMPSFVDAIPAAEDRWALAAYVKSLVRSQKTGHVLKARFHAGAIPADPWAAAWEKAGYVDFLLAGQIIIEPRWFTPAHDVITARALYNGREIAILVEWDDGTHNRGGAKPADEVELQFPARPDTGDERPYFVLGDRKNPVELWRWNAGKGLTRLIAEGADRLREERDGGIAAEGTYRDGQYRVIFRRALVPESKDALRFEPGRFVPVAFHLRDGDAGEEGLKMAVSAWYYVIAELPTPVTAYLWPLVLGLATVGGEIWLLRQLRRRKGVAA